MTAAECPNCRCRDMGGADQWREDGEGFRKGRWTVAVSGDVIDLSHDEAGPALARKSAEMRWSHLPSAEDVLDSFLTWFAATYTPTPVEPTEPTAYGYVGTLASTYGANHHVYRYLGGDVHAYRIVGLIAGNEARTLSWGTVLQAGKFTAVTS